MTAMAKRFSDEEKAAAVERALSDEETKRQVAEDVGVSETTLYRWIKSASQRPASVSHLRVAPPPEEPEPEPRKARTISEAASGGDYRAMLERTMMRLAKALDDPNTSPRDLASNSRRFLETARELQALDSADGDDEIGKAAATPDDDWDASAI